MVVQPAHASDVRETELNSAAAGVQRQIGADHANREAYAELLENMRDNWLPAAQ